MENKTFGRKNRIEKEFKLFFSCSISSRMFAELTQRG